MGKAVLVIDDDPQILDLIRFTLEDSGYDVMTAKDADEGILKAITYRMGLILLDIRLPDKDGLTVLKELRAQNVTSYVVMMSAHGTIKLALESLKLGAYDFLEKPFEIEELELKVKHAFERFALAEEVDDLRKQLGEKYRWKALVGNSLPMQDVYRRIEMAAKRPMTNILVLGESGTGKELVARAIHFSSAQKEEPFVAIHCGAIPISLLESELFGHEKGAFTGADTRKIGKFEQAKGGTLFLDEIGDLSLDVQVKLLRVLQEREIERIGGRETIEIKSRFIFATNQDLEKRVAEEKFREDLYYRIKVFMIDVPPLRDRREDIPELIEHCIKKYALENQKVTITKEAIKVLMEYAWPGNVRELENTLEQIMVMKTALEDQIQAEDLSVLNSKPPQEQPKQIISPREIDKAMLEEALSKTKGNVSQACKVLKIGRDTFYRKMKKYGRSS